MAASPDAGPGDGATGRWRLSVDAGRPWMGGIAVGSLVPGVARSATRVGRERPADP
jgi:hypothetical protein